MSAPLVAEAVWEADMRYSTELESILSRFGAGPVSKDEVLQYLTRQSSQATEQHAEGVLSDLEDEGYVETTSGEKGELVQFTDKAIDEVFG
jgi:CTP-dependent riboflavin kinase